MCAFMRLNVMDDVRISEGIQLMRFALYMEKTSNNWNNLIILDYHKNPEEKYPGQNCE